MNLNEYAKKIHQANHKWWVDLETGSPIERNKYELKMLIVSELAECLEGERKNLMDDKLPHRKMAEVEMADTLIRVLDYAAGLGIIIEDFPNHLIEDLERQKSPDNKAEYLFCITQCVGDEELYPEANIRLIIFMIENYCKKFGYDLWVAVEEKLAYNAIREDHKIEARKAANGKKF